MYMSIIKIESNVNFELKSLSSSMCMKDVFGYRRTFGLSNDEGDEDEGIISSDQVQELS